MKKSLFSLMAVVLFTGSTYSTSSTSNDNCESSVNCWKQSDMLTNWVAANVTLSNEQEYQLFESLFDECVANYPCG